ncbi:helix-turn-helix domain-containing protein [Haloarcula salinisoli]|uniref:Helix-turn-helix domain-containing protein n=1 Tax=Haloarcula salinisoli TaxID=2487746 RepID=A0A8J8CEL2_9EURY|nr:helix-turn-helix domain-containing protein [Halomicroarcula salinisoli]MBX0288363.1 helix-turn-helix domain-containing protein [Halomicroarcula salinisoli]MBX0305845.1 helix-turn-helix domain-containing protein [Halomicroarcula salinisoli]
MATIVIGSVPTEELALAHTFEELPDVTFESERIILSGDDAVMPLLWARNATREPLEAAIDEDPTVNNVNLLADFGDELLYRMDWIDQVQLLLHMLTNSEATILDAHGRREGWRVRVMFPDRSHLSETHEFCKAHGMEFTIESIRQMDGQPSGRFGLTEDQYLALITAVEEGYYDVPQQRTLEELAEEFEISHQALSERLRRGTESLVEDTLLVGTPSDG